MIRRPLLLRGAAFLWCLTVLAACSSPNPAIYTIGVQPGPVVGNGPKIIELRDIGLAGYLDRPHIVRSSEGNRLEVMANDTWGEPLGGLIGRVLAVELAQRLPDSNVYGERSAISIGADAVVQVNIQRMDVGSDGALMLLAQAAVKFKNKKPPAARTFSISKPLDAMTTASEVAAISAAIGELADGIAVMLHQ